jgi:hypothetical protein
MGWFPPTVTFSPNILKVGKMTGGREGLASPLIMKDLVEMAYWQAYKTFFFIVTDKKIDCFLLACPTTLD